MKSVYLTMPVYGPIRHEAASSFFCHQQDGTVCDPEGYFIYRKMHRSSLIARGCNIGLAEAICMGCNFFVMLHSDVHPEENWLPQLLTLGEKWDMVSVVLAIKDNSRTTSTATCQTWADAGIDSTLIPLDKLVDLPLEFTLSDLGMAPPAELLLNTGCCCINLDKLPPIGDGICPVYFNINDFIVFQRGIPTVVTNPEDWFLSHRMNQLGLKICATHRILATHIGMAQYPNT